MHIVELIFNSTLLWIFLQTMWLTLVGLFYDFCIPWVIWCSLLITVGLKYIRIPPPPPSIVNEVVGLNPLCTGKGYINNDSECDDHYCMRVVAHRGAAFDYPENSLTAFCNSKDKGCTAVEFDLSLTKDKIPILFHDLTTDRVTGHIGKVKDMTWDELRTFDITHNHPLKNKFVDGEKIPSLYEVLEECLKNDQRIIIDIKERTLEIVQIVLDAYKRYPKLYQRGIVSSFNPIVVYMIRRQDPKIVSSLAWRPHMLSRIRYVGLEGPGPARFTNPLKHVAACLMDILYEWSFTRFVYYVVGISVVLLHKDTINPRVIETWHEHGVRVMAWTVNLPSEKQYFSRHLKITYLTDTLLADNLY